MANQFFQKLNHEWDNGAPLRKKYAEGIPIPTSKYFKGIHSIDELAVLMVRAIEKPLWLGLNAFGYLLKALLSAMGAILLAPFVILTNIFLPNANFTRSMNTPFCIAAANTFASLGMCLIAAVSTIVSVVFNPLCLITRCVGTVFEGIHAATEPCFGSGSSSDFTF